MNLFRALAGIRAARVVDRKIDGAIKTLLSARREKLDYLSDRDAIGSGDQSWKEWSISCSPDVADDIEHALVKGNGVIIGACFSGYHIPALSLLKPHARDCLILQGTPNQIPMPEWLRVDIYNHTGIKVQILPVDSSSAITLLRHLRKNGIALLMLDMTLPGTSAISVDFLGHPATTASGIYKITSKAQSTIIPVFPMRNSRGLSVVHGKPLGGEDIPYQILAQRAVERVE